NARGSVFRRTAIVGAVALLLTAFQLAPLVRDASNINHSRWESSWKWDSFGAGQVLKWLFAGDLLDYGRPPVLTLLAFAGAGLVAATAAAAVVSALLRFPMVRDRARNLANDAAYGRKNLQAHAVESPSLNAAIAIAQQRGGRAYAGLAAGWGGKFKIGEVPF